MSGATDVNWRASAACLEEDLKLFFGPDEESPGEQEAREAKAVGICSGCQVRRQCGQWAMDTNTTSGVFGGMGENRRARTRRAEMRRARRDRNDREEEAA